MRLLTLDIETLPHEVYAWGLHDQSVGLNQIIRPGVVACWAAKFHGERTMHFASMRDGEKAMLRKIHSLMGEADAVIGWNSTSFDVKWLQGQFVKVGLGPPEPFKQIDLLRTARAKFKLASNKLDYVAGFLGIGQKVKTGGFDLWRDCMAGDDRAWQTMERYNKADVKLTEAVYERLLPWITNHPNRSVYTGEHCCPKCESTKLQARGYAITTTRRYVRYQCKVCGAWSQSVASEPGSALIKAVA